MDIEPMHSFPAAAKYDFLSNHIKSGSLVYVHLPNVKLDLKSEKVKYVTSVNREKMISDPVRKPFHCHKVTKTIHRKAT